MCVLAVWQSLHCGGLRDFVCVLAVWQSRHSGGVRVRAVRRVFASASIPAFNGCSLASVQCGQTNTRHASLRACASLQYGATFHWWYSLYAGGYNSLRSLCSSCSFPIGSHWSFHGPPQPGTLQLYQCMPVLNRALFWSFYHDVNRRRRDLRRNFGINLE